MLKRLVPCGNPVVNRLLGGVKRSIPRDTFKPVLKNGTRYCAWCAVKPPRNSRSKYCSTDCQESCDLMCYPQTDRGAAHLMRERGCHCAKCGFSWKDFALQAYEEKPEKWFKPAMDDLRLEIFSARVVMRTKMLVPKIRAIEIDHIIPVALGGTTFGFENLQLLCHECHKEKTRTDLAEIARARKEGDGTAS